MLNKISIKSRMILLLLIPIITVALVTYFAYAAIAGNKAVSENIFANTHVVGAANKLNIQIGKNYTTLLRKINEGSIPWNKAYEKIEIGLTAIEERKNTLVNNNKQYWSDRPQKPVKELLAEYDKLIASYKSIVPIFSIDQNEENTAILAEYSKEMYANYGVFKSKVFPFIQSGRSSSRAFAKLNANNAGIKIQQLKYTASIGLLFLILAGISIVRSITKPTNKIIEVIKKIAQGDLDTRIETTGSDEFYRLSSAFNTLLDDRAVTLDTIDSEHQELNQSVFGLLQAVAELSERNLTIRANVTEDATGPVADAINLLAEETASTLLVVRNIAQDVNETSQKVNTHLMSVNKLAMKEQERAIETTDQMNKMLLRLDSIAESAAATNLMADNTTISTRKAHESVSDTLNGMAVIRETVQETGKRIKQLGERSQEISHVIDIINTIAERTTVLALNASMQAVAAGDAGRGFSVIAEEIQRLAESSRESTNQISTLVRNIQQETNTTIAKMDQTIEQVIDGSTKAEDAAEQMQRVLETTSELVHSVDQIAIASKDQVSISEGLKHKAEGILKSTQSTGQELLSLTGLSRNMAEYAQQLVKSVNVFKIDENDTEETIQNAKV